MYKFINGKKLFFEKGRLSCVTSTDGKPGILCAVYDPSSGFSYTNDYKKLGTVFKDQDEYRRIQKQKK